MYIGKTYIDFNTNRINGPAGDVSVEPLVMQVLKALVDNAGQVVARNDLIDAVWGIGVGGDERLSRAISILRKSLGDTRKKHKHIQTIPRRGYMLISDINISDQIEKTDLSQTIEPDNQTTNKSKKWLFAGLVAAAFMLIATTFISKESNLFNLKSTPLVMIMDSSFPARIYDEETTIDGGTNADILSDILADLPLQSQKESISPNWHRYEAITKFEPDLILIHYSGFNHEDASGDRPQLKLLFEYFLDTNTQFIVYSRATEAWLQDKMNNLLASMPASKSRLLKRIHIFPLLEYGEPHWKDSASAQAVKLKIKEVLALE